MMKLRYSTSAGLIRDFASRGLIVLSPEALGIPMDIHDNFAGADHLDFAAVSPVKWIRKAGI